ncbi:MAG: Glycosyl transferase family 2 [Candidatus Roizmanbacteria bacterium GW2011_GWA2_36_23]|uniref:Glycosyl transferase family 2 n=1 Tax=Candidatus Roizmanbacteria bacterium GW2011_GWA2_36_23 TaxID=1618480 RepID=A0A0G0GQH8_9BACT|nr:MAG: Glycosyl transferase family 2 [Candidatus Roizmanbacteria bacterium GW2011_GWA2_36_23]
MQIIALIIVILSIINLIRITVFLIGSDIYNLVAEFKSRRRNRIYFSLFSVVIPAYNEEQNIIKCVESVFENKYPKDKLQVIIVDDGSKDATLKLIGRYKQDHPAYHINIVSQKNSGKAQALNNGMKNYAKGELVMCLDSDSFLEENAIANAVGYFEDDKIMAVASNVKITNSSGLLNLIQQFEYIVSYQMKRAQTLFNIEYIIGGIGSTFRKNFLEKINYYDINTVTEDIDLTLKILHEGNKRNRVVYGADIVSYTQSVLSISELIKQRFRWKWGRYQTFLKNRQLFFAKDNIYTRGLTWFYLPYALFSDALFLLEPLVVSFILFITFYYHDVFTLLSAVSVITFYLIMNVLSEDTISWKRKTQLIIIAPFMYFFFYILSMVEYIALIKSIINLPDLKKSLSSNKSGWVPVRRFKYFTRPDLH